MHANKILTTQDGSHTLESAQFGVTYHSIFGAIEESMHVFLAAGLDFALRNGRQSQINVLEMGFGTGLNAWLSQVWSDYNDILIDYTTIERYPISPIEVKSLNYPQAVSFQRDYSESFYQLHESEAGITHTIDSNFRFTKHHCDIFDFELTTETYDVIFYDAFAPSSQPELWEANLHQRLYHSLKANGCIVTYCAKGAFKRMLKSLGYTIDRLNGPNRKHEMTRGVKQI